MSSLTALSRASHDIANSTCKRFLRAFPTEWKHRNVSSKRRRKINQSTPGRHALDPDGPCWSMAEQNRAPLRKLPLPVIHELNILRTGFLPGTGGTVLKDKVTHRLMTVSHESCMMPCGRPFYGLTWCSPNTRLRAHPQPAESPSLQLGWECAFFTSSLGGSPALKVEEHQFKTIDKDNTLR